MVCLREGSRPVLGVLIFPERAHDKDEPDVGHVLQNGSTPNGYLSLLFVSRAVETGSKNKGHRIITTLPSCYVAEGIILRSLQTWD